MVLSKELKQAAQRIANAELKRASDGETELRRRQEGWLLLKSMTEEFVDALTANGIRPTPVIRCIREEHSNLAQFIGLGTYKKGRIDIGPGLWDLGIILVSAKMDIYRGAQPLILGRSSPQHNTMKDFTSSAEQRGFNRGEHFYSEDQLVRLSADQMWRITYQAPYRDLNIVDAYNETSTPLRPALVTAAGKLMSGV